VSESQLLLLPPSPPPLLLRALTRTVADCPRRRLGVPYGQGVLCNAKPCVYCKGGLKSNGPKGCSEACQNPEPGAAGPAAPGCPKPQVVNLTLDLYTPIGAEALGPRPALVAIHSGGYVVNGERGFAPSYEMTAACKYFAARGWVAITMIYRMDNGQTGGGLAPANWTGSSPLPKGWKGGFLPKPQAIYPAIRDTKHAIRWLRGHAAALNIDNGAFASAGWSAGACTSVFLASQFESDFTDEMDATTDPTFHTMVRPTADFTTCSPQWQPRALRRLKLIEHGCGQVPFLNLSSKVSAGVVWAGNGVATDTYDALDSQDRFKTTVKTPLAMYRGAKDGTMTPWAQAEVQGQFNATGGHCDLFAVPGHGHGDLMPAGLVATKNGVAVGPDQKIPVLNHSYTWLVEQMNLTPID
jgi:acetyl esterase/lipase